MERDVHKLFDLRPNGWHYNPKKELERVVLGVEVLRADYAELQGDYERREQSSPALTSSIKTFEGGRVVINLDRRSSRELMRYAWSQAELATNMDCLKFMLDRAEAIAA